MARGGSRSVHAALDEVIEMLSHYLVAYDVCDQKRLRQVHKTVKDFGFGVQLSVYLCRLNAKDKANLEGLLLDIIHRDFDQVLFVNLGAVTNPDEPVPRFGVLGRELAVGPGRVFVL